MNGPTISSVSKENVWKNNPVAVQILGICSALAVTNTLINTLIMTLGVTFVTGLSSFTIAIIKSLIPRKVRMITQTLIIAFYVIIVDIILRAYLPDISKSLGPYVGLIITNCIIMGRAEAFAQSNKPFLSLIDGLTSGFGYMIILIIIAFIRELLGSGSILGFTVMPKGFISWTIMLTPPSAFFILGFLIWGMKSIMLKKEKKA